MDFPFEAHDSEFPVAPYLSPSLGNYVIHEQQEKGTDWSSPSPNQRQLTKHRKHHHEWHNVTTDT
jgi:hypothetical protein